MPEVILKTELITIVDMCLSELGLLGFCRWEGNFRVSCPTFYPEQKLASCMAPCLHDCEDRRLPSFKAASFPVRHL